MGEMYLFPKRLRMAGVQDTTLGGETTSRKVGFDKKNSQITKASLNSLARLTNT